MDLFFIKLFFGLAEMYPGKYQDILYEFFVQLAFYFVFVFVLLVH